MKLRKLFFSFFFLVGTASIQQLTHIWRPSKYSVHVLLMSDSSRLSDSANRHDDARVIWNKLKGISVFMSQQLPYVFLAVRIIVVPFLINRCCRSTMRNVSCIKILRKMDRSYSELPAISLPASPNPASSSTPLKLRYQLDQVYRDENLFWFNQPEFFFSFFFYGKGCSSNGESVPSTPGILTPSGIPRKESYKMQRKNYRFEKKKAANELLCTLKDPTVIVLADWLKGKLTASVRQNWVDFL